MTFGKKSTALLTVLYLGSSIPVLAAYVPPTGQIFNLSQFGAKCGGVQVTDGAGSSTSPNISSASDKWGSVKTGWIAVVNTGATGGKQLVTTIKTVTNSGHLVLNTNLGATISAATISIYPDDTTAFNLAISAANAANVPLGMPAGAVCGVSNPGSANAWNITFPAFYLNGATLWLGQTGPTSDTGWSLNMEGINYSGGANGNWSGVKLVGPGTIDGLYQTNQGIEQLSLADGVVWNNGGTSTITNAAIVGPITIQNTKGTAFSAQGVKNFSVANLVMQNCGDFSYQHSSTPGDMTGRPMCGIIAGVTGHTDIKNIVGTNAAQSGLLLTSSTSDNTHDTSISGCSFSGNGYYGFDAEVDDGSINLSGCHVTNSESPSDALIYGGFIWRDVAYERVTNIGTLGIDSNAWVNESVDGNSNFSNWDLANADFYGSSNHAAAMYIAFGATGVPQRISLTNVTTDTLTVAPASSPACTDTNPRMQLFEFDDLNVTQNSGPTYSTTFQPQGSASQMLYVLGRDSNLGTVQMNYALNNPMAIYFDNANVLMNGAPTFTGASSSATYATLGTSNPLDSFSCP